MRQIPSIMHARGCQAGHNHGLMFLLVKHVRVSYIKEVTLLTGAPMPQRSQQDDPAVLQQRLATLVDNFGSILQKGDIREQVLALVPIYQALRGLGASVLPDDDTGSGRARILAYFRRNVGQIISTNELMVVAGIGDYPRRIRELRKQYGWPIMSGARLRMLASDELTEDGLDSAPTSEEMDVDEYVLLEDVQDHNAALRWKQANEIRNSSLAVRDRVLAYLRASVGQRVTGEELAYVAKGASDWPRRTRELRTEYGWPVVTRQSGRPDLPTGVYVLEEDRQSEPHDRRIPDPIRRAALVRDGYRCQHIGCGWHHSMWNPADPRHLELHHRIHHAMGGQNTLDNLITLCNVHHDEVHRNEGTAGI